MEKGENRRERHREGGELEKWRIRSIPEDSNGQQYPCPVLIQTAFQFAEAKKARITVGRSAHPLGGMICKTLVVEGYN